MEFIRQAQPHIMLMLSSICGIIALFVFFTRAIGPARKTALMMIELSAMLLLISDMLAYTFRGNVSTLGYYIVRISNFLVFFLTLLMIYSFNIYLIDLLTKEGKLEKVPGRLKVARILLIAGAVLVILSQFTGLYYTFDATNHYQRSSVYLFSYIAPFATMVMQLTAVLKYGGKLKRNIRTSLILFTILPFAASILQYFTYGISLTNVTLVNMAVLVFIFALIDLNETVDRAAEHEIEMLKQEQKKIERLYLQTAQALSRSIDAKDKYTHGHSARVAKYAKMIARYAGKSEKECDEYFYAALLHDVGKIGIPDVILNKEGKLTNEEYNYIRQHPVIGKKILSNITQSPYLSIGANFHHERYDGRGYPDGLKGEDIPEVSRVIAVADSYDAMTSKRSYRDPIPQQRVREEIVKGIGTQFDPVYARIMLKLIDEDTGYLMREKPEVRDLSGDTELICDDYRSAFSEGIRIFEYRTHIHLHSWVLDGESTENALPSMVLFDFLDERIHSEDAEKREMVYFEYGEIRFDGRTVCSGARKMQTEIKLNKSDTELNDTTENNTQGINYEIEAVRYLDHALIRIGSSIRTIQVTVALPDSSRFLYLALTGEHCVLGDLIISQDEVAASEGDIPRIMEMISYIDEPAGDVPNVQVNGYRTNATEGIPVCDGLTVSFHSISLPTARLVWHCPYIVLFYSEDRKAYGAGYHEYALIRMDGESWKSGDYSENRMPDHKTEAFPGWESFKKINRQGVDYEVHFHVDGNVIRTETENLGIVISNETFIREEIKEVYVAVTGDQCALTNIRIQAPRP